MEKILFLGAGAVGATLIAQFLDANYPICVLCDINRKNKYLQSNFVVNRRQYKFNFITKDEYRRTADIVIIAVKYFNLQDAIRLLKGIVGENTIIMSLLNGIDSEDIIAKKFNYSNLIFSFIYNIDAVRSNNVINYTKKGIIVFGEKNGQISEKIIRVRDVFNIAKINYEISKNILKRMWWKYMINIGMNQTTAVLRAPYWVLQEICYSQEIARAAMKEVVQISQALNINLSQEDINKHFERLMHFQPDGKTSMLQDVEAKRKTEVEMFSGKICQIGKKLNIQTPINKMFYILIKSIESMY
ncbi:MAG: ketopantoate reductase family protein [Atribacterota bacterium]|nr:ketopantoate reductase family protein [Atribacterota bacterium]